MTDPSNTARAARADVPSVAAQRVAESSSGSAELEQQRPLLGLKASALVATVLLVPFAVKAITKAEPYPAVFLPGGSATLPVIDGKGYFVARIVMGFTPEGDPVEVDLNSFLDPLPVQYIYDLIDGSFGQDESSRSTIRLSGLGTEFDVPRHVPSAADRQDARDWMSRHLARKGLRPDRFEVWSERIEVDHETGEPSVGEVLDKEVYRLA